MGGPSTVEKDMVSQEAIWKQRLDEETKGAREWWGNWSVKCERSLTHSHILSRRFSLLLPPPLIFTVLTCAHR